MTTHLSLLIRNRLFAVLPLAILLFSSSASALVMRDNGPEPIIVQIKESLRLSDDLDNRLSQLAATHNQDGLQVVKWWAGSKFLLMLSFPSNFTEQQALTAIGRIEQLPAVEKVVPFSAFNLHFRSGDFVRSYSPNQTIPDVARRGFDAQRIGSPPPSVLDQASLDLVPHVSNHLIVRWNEERIWRADITGFAQVMENFHRDAGCRVVREIRFSPIKLTQILEFDDPSTLAEKLRRYIESGLVVYAQPDFLYETMAIPDDPWYLNPPRGGSQWPLPIISAPQAWDMFPPPLTKGDPSVIIAVADSGANVHHPDFITNLWSGQNNGDPHNFFAVPHTTDVDDDFDPEYHGSAVASIIGAQGGFNTPGNTQIDMTGVAWDTSLMILKAVGSMGESNTGAVTEAIHYAADHGATAINVSIGFYDAICHPTFNQPSTALCTEGQYDKDLVEAMEYARSQNMVVVSAAGNGAAFHLPDGSTPDNNDVNLNRISPASIPTDNNISVLATKRDDNRASYSSYGKYRVDLAAPGGESSNDPGTSIVGLYQAFHIPPTSDDQNSITGTSAAAPHVAGALALIKSLYPWEDYAGIRDRVLMGTDAIPGSTPGIEGKCRTNGRLNIYKALQPRSLLLNVSTRARVEGGDNVMIAGFVIGGSSGTCGGLTPNPPCLKVVIRGLGPSVGVNVAKLVDPVIELHGPAGFKIINDNWQDDPAQAAELVALGFQPSDPSEAAMVQSLSPGAYTVILRTATGSSNDYGVGLVELYALENNEQFRFKNVSTRCLVGTDDEVAIAGTVIGNTSASPSLPKPDRRLLIFGKGPSLGMGIDSSIFLTDPQIQIANTSLYNDNWTTIDDDSGDGTALEEKLVEAQFAPRDSRESALWPTFSPGSYTVILSGQDHSTGIGLIEFYEY